MQRRKRNAGSSSDGTEDSDFSTDPEHTDSSESDGTSRRSARVTRSSARLSQSSQDSSPVHNPPSFGAEEPVYSTRRVTRSQQQPTPVTPKKYPLRQTRSSGSETEQVVDFSDRDTKNAADHDESPPRTPTGNAPSSESDIDISSPNVSHDESIAKDMSMKDSGSDLSHRPKRRRFHESYNFNMKCPTPGCNSLGHLTGKHERHFSISGCPLYHNLSADECKVRAQSRDKQIEERMLAHRQDDNRHATRHQAPTERQLRYKEKVAELRKKRNSGLSMEQKEKYMEHRQTYGNTREPLLENLTSEYDLELFRRAQAHASEDLGSHSFPPQWCRGWGLWSVHYRWTLLLLLLRGRPPHTSHCYTVGSLPMGDSPSRNSPAWVLPMGCSSSQTAPAWGLQRGQLLTPCPNVGRPPGEQSFRDRLLQPASLMGSQVLTANLLWCGLLSPHRLPGPSRNLLQGEAASPGPDHRRQQYDQNNHFWPLRAGYLVSFSLPRGVCSSGVSLHV
ncbi:histone acetyltransferase KAT7-like isoform X5 [Colius striatus]|uniref:histone acetyltransferase KAT7-like isoform X5 n=1 Tax=Colius striatus TaxID=57412 RepID=UPI002B1E75C0|nr:histone acetyltransferase KAT7-like isoform X5 [Colius striatus]